MRFKPVFGKIGKGIVLAALNQRLVLLLLGR